MKIIQGIYRHVRGSSIEKVNELVGAGGIYTLNYRLNPQFTTFVQMIRPLQINH